MRAYRFRVVGWVFPIFLGTLVAVSINCRVVLADELATLKEKLSAAIEAQNTDRIAELESQIAELEKNPKPSVVPDPKPDEKPVAKVGDQKIEGWEQDSVPIKNAINEQIRQANENIRNWESAQRVGSAASRGMKHRNGEGSSEDSSESDFQEDTQSAPPKPTIQDAIRAAGLPPKGFVYSRVPNADGSIKFKIYAWPPDEAQDITRAANEALNARELQFALANGVPGGSTQSGVSGTSSNSSNGGITNNLNLNIPQSEHSSFSGWNPFRWRKEKGNQGSCEAKTQSQSQAKLRPVRRSSGCISDG